MIEDREPMEEYTEDKELNIFLLAKLRDHCLAIDKEVAGGRYVRAFDMNGWWMTKKEREDADYQPDFKQCDTACCLLGEATCVPEIAAAGLRVDCFKSLSDGEFFSIKFYQNGEVSRDEDGDVLHNSGAGAVAFGLNEREENYLFYPDQYLPDLADAGVISRDDWIEDGDMYEYIGHGDEGEVMQKITPAMCAAHIDRVIKGEFR